MKKYTPEKLDDIVQLIRVIRIRTNDDDDSPEEEGGLDDGLYAQDSLGRVWVLKEEISELVFMFDMADPFKKKERHEARERMAKKKAERKREQA